VDSNHHLFITHHVINIGNDRSQHARVAKKSKATLDSDTLDVVADRGYFDSVEILACEEAGVTVVLPKRMTSNAKADGRFGKKNFRYIVEDDVYICSAGERSHLPLHGRGKWDVPTPLLDQCLRKLQH
jgi:hypothetical protein